MSRQQTHVHAPTVTAPPLQQREGRRGDARTEAAATRSRSNGDSAPSNLRFKFGQVAVHATPSPTIQPKLVVGEVGDAYEQEADRVANQVMAGESVSAPVSQNALGSEQLRRQPEEQQDEEEDDEKDVLQASPLPNQTPQVTPSLANQLTTAQGQGQPLPRPTRQFFESRFGQNLNQVRVHSDAPAATAANTLRARAFTHKQDIFFGNGYYQPETPTGKWLLAHELTHTLQQRPGVVARQAVDAPVAEPPATEPGSPEADGQSSESVDAIATEVLGLIQSDSSDQSRRARERLAALDVTTRRAVMARVQRQLPPAKQGLVVALLAESATGGESLTIAPPVSPAALPSSTPSPVADRTRRRRASGGRTETPPQATGVTTPTPPSPSTARTPGLPTPPISPTPQVDESSGNRTQAIATRNMERQSTEVDNVQQDSNEATANVEAQTAQVESQPTGEEEAGAAFPRLADLIEPLPEEPTAEATSEPDMASAPVPTVTPETDGDGTALATSGAATSEEGMDLASAEPSPEMADMSETAPTAEPSVDIQSLVSSLSAAPAEAESRIQAQATAMRATLATRGQSIIAAIRAQINRTVTAIRATVSTQRNTLQTALTAARSQVASQLTARRAEATTRGERAKNNLRDLFRNHRTTMETTVTRNISAAERMRTTYGNQTHNRTLTQSRTTRQRGQSQAQGYPNTERGRVQADAARGVADRTAREIEQREPETIQAIEEVVAPIPKEFRQRGQEALTGYDNGLPDLLNRVDQQVSAAQNALDQQAAQANRQLDTMGNQMQKQLNAIEQAAISRAEAIAPQAETQIRSGLRTAQSSISQAAPQAMSRINSIVTEAIEILNAAESPNSESSRAFTEQVLGFVTGATDETITVIQESGSGMQEQLQRAEPAARQGLQAVQQQTNAQIQSEAESSNAALSRFVEEVDRNYGNILQQMDESNAEVENQVRDNLSQAVRRLEQDFGQVMRQAEAKMVEAVDAGMAKNDEALGQLQGQMREAAEDAAWDFDHPVLSTLRDVGLIVAGVIAGILAVLVLVVVAIVAFKLLVAGLVALGVSLAVAEAIALIAGLALLAYGIYQAYSARREQGQGGWEAFGGALLDLTGITNIRRAFSEPNLSPFERGYAFGQGIATLASFFIGRRLNRGINRRLPRSITNPNRGVAVRWFRGRFGRDTGLSNRGYRPASPAERSMTREQWRAQHRAERMNRPEGLARRGYRPAAGERAMTREQWRAQYRAERLARPGLRDVSYRGQRVTPELSPPRPIVEPPPNRPVTTSPVGSQPARPPVSSPSEPTPIGQARGSRGPQLRTQRPTTTAEEFAARRQQQIAGSRGNAPRPTSPEAVPQARPQTVAEAAGAEGYTPRPIEGGAGRPGVPGGRSPVQAMASDSRGGSPPGGRAPSPVRATGTGSRGGSRSTPTSAPRPARSSSRGGQSSSPQPAVARTPRGTAVEASERASFERHWAGRATESFFGVANRNFGELADLLATRRQMLAARGQGNLLPELNTRILDMPVETFIEAYGSRQLRANWARLRSNPAFRSEVESVFGSGRDSIIRNRKPDFVEFDLNNRSVEISDVTLKHLDPVHALKSAFYREVMQYLFGSRGPRVRAFELYVEHSSYLEP